MNITVLYYDPKTKKQELQNTVTALKDVLEDTVVLAIPKEYDLLLDCSVDQLVSIRAMIDTALSLKVQQLEAIRANKESMNSQDSSISSNIIDFSQYLS